MIDQTSTVAGFLEAAAGRQPAPGGGSVTALVGALSAAMGEMTVNYSIGRKGLEAHAAELEAAKGELHRARGMLVQLMVEDQLAYEAVTALRKLDEADARRREEMPVALLACIRVPQAIAATGVAVLEICDRIVEQVNSWLLSDLAVCADLAMATVRCATYNVRVNLKDVSDAAERQSIETETNEMLSRAIDLIQRVSPRIWGRVGEANR
jgi:methenyltetrahydrofolate cyclohydrolase